MGRITGRDLLEQLAAFVVDLNELFGGFRQRATAVSSAFRGPEFGFVLVASSRPTALDESLALLAHLESEKMSADAFVLNRMPERVGAASSAEIEQALRDRAVSGSADLALRIGRAAADQDERAARADARVVKLQRALAERGRASPPLVRVPELRAEVQGIDGLRQIARMLAATS
jgi:anion-transporting  ArsA/GET3 family ATPase